MSLRTWSDASVPSLNTHKLARRGEEVLQKIAACGVTLPKDNRLKRAIRAMDELNIRYRAGADVRPEDVDEQQRLAEAHRLLFEALVIVFARTERQTGPRTITQAHLRALLDGGDLPDATFDHPRNLQFEAYVGATLVLSGLAVRYAEPDFVFQYYEAERGVAAKRLLSRKSAKLFDRMREAAHQLSEAGHVGYVAVNLDNWVQEAWNTATADEVGAQFENDMRDAYRQLAKASSRPALVGAMIHANWSRWDFGGATSTFALRTAAQHLTLTDEEADEARAVRLMQPAQERLLSSLREVGALVASDT